MRNRIGIASALHIGRSVGTDFSLDNELGELSESQKELLNEIAKDFISQFDSEEKGYKLGGYDRCDFGWLTTKVLVVGLEPSYRWDRLLVFQFDLENMETSAVITGTSFGPYGSQVAYKMKYLREYRRNSKFKAFIEKWYEKIKEELL